MDMWNKFFSQKESKDDSQRFVKSSFSQCGEDLIIKYIFYLKGVKKPSYLDIGAHHPYYLNNTALFYLKGSRGINIEANPNLIQLFHKHRGADVNLNIGIGPSNSELDFYVFKDSTLSTFSAEEREKMVMFGKDTGQSKYQLLETIKVSVKTVEEVLNEYASGIMPDLLTIDVEGLDYQILQSIDFSVYRPKVICVEISEHSPTGRGARITQLASLIESLGYFEYATTNLNSIFIEEQFWFGE